MQALGVRFKIWLWALCLVSCALNLANAHATVASNDNIDTSFAGWLDHTGTATADNVLQRATWEPFADWRSWGFGPEPVWLRINVPAAATANDPSQILIVRPPYLDRVTFYDSAMGAVRRTGDFFPFTEDALGSVLFTFEVPARTEARVILVRLESSSTRLVYLSLIPLSAAQSLTRWVEWATGGALLLSLLFLIWALLAWWETRDRVVGAFAVNQLVVSLWGFSSLGFARITVGELFAPGVLSMFSSVTAALMVSAIIWFFGHLLAEYGPHAWMLRVLQVGGWVTLGGTAMTLIGPPHLTLQMLNSLVPLVLAWLVLTLWAANPEKNKPLIPKAFMMGYVSFYSFLNAIPTLTFLGLIPGSWILFFGNMSSLVANGLVMFIILTVRQRRFKEQHQTMSTQLMLQQEQARLDQQHVNEQRQLLAMLAHEMKTPLANLRVWMEAGPKGRPVMERAIHDMNRVLERCVQTGQLADHRLQPHNDWLDAAELTQTVLASSRQPNRVTLELSADDCTLLADAQMLSIVLSNVLENAYKYSASDTPIMFRLTAQESLQGEPGWCWQIENTVGPAGLPEADKVFDKYYRSPNAKRQSGSGLGLFLVKSLLTLMQGKVSYTPLPEHVRFEVWLPRQPAQVHPHV